MVNRSGAPRNSISSTVKFPFGSRGVPCQPSGLEADQVDIELDDSDGLLDLPARGAFITLWLGWQGTPLEPKGDFTVGDI